MREEGSSEWLNEKQRFGLWDNAGLMLVQRRRQWAYIKPALAQRLVLVWGWLTGQGWGLGLIGSEKLGLEV